MAGRFAIGVDLGGQSVKLAVVDEAGRVLLRRQAVVDASQHEPEIRWLILGEINALRHEAEGHGFWPACVGLVMPGYLDSQRKKVLFAANLPTLNGTDFLAGIRDAMELPTVFDADSNAAAFGEYRFGAGRDVERLLVVVVGTGIGAGVILGGQVVRIWNHIAGSLGHVIVDARGPKCACGSRGCVEALAAGPALEKRAKEAVADHADSRLAALARQAGRLTGVEVGAALRKSDPVAAEVVRETGWWLGAGIAAWSVIFRPAKVLIGGGVAALGEPLLKAVRQGLAEVGQPAATKDVIVEAAALGADAGIVGAAALAMK
ncbi:MAG TPA: ROK family protein [Phycisphaerae bacterium]|nr:ROK family protein [Phycisphaerae bacterium]